MPQIYAPPNVTDSEGIFELLRYVNTTADGLLFPMLLFVIFIITFIATKQFASSKAFAYASFITMVLAIPLAVLDLVAPKFMYLFIILTAVGMVWLKLDGGGRSF